MRTTINGICLVFALPFALASPATASDPVRICEVKHHAKQLHPISISPDGTLLATSDDDGAVTLYDAKTGRRSQVLACDIGAITSIAFDATSNLLVAGGSSSLVQVFKRSKDSYTMSQTLKGHAGIVTAVAAIERKGAYLIVTGSTDCAVMLWDLKAASYRTFKHHTASVSAVGFMSADRMISTALDGKIVLWESATAVGKASVENSEPTIRTAILCPSEEYVISRREDGEVQKWKLGASKPVWSRSASPKATECLAFAIKSKWVFYAEKMNRIIAVDAASAKTRSAIEFGSEIGAFCLDRSSSRLAVGYRSGQIEVWDISGLGKK